MNPLQNLDWSLVQAYLAVAEAGSLSAAARQLNLSQPTLGRHIHAIEAALNVSLFNRQSRGMELTDAGLSLLESAKAMHSAANRLRLLAAGQAEDLAGTIRITASQFFSHHVLPPILADLRRTSPEIAIELVASDTSENLLFREADIAIRMYRPEQLDMVTRHLGDVEIGLCAARSYLDRKGRPANFDDLNAHDFVGYDASDLIIRGMRAVGVHVDRDWFAVRCDNQTAYWELVRAGCGIGVTQRNVSDADPLVEPLDFGVEIPKLPVWLTTHERLRQTARVRRVWDHLITHLQPLLS